MATDSAHARQQQLLLALVAAGATILGGLIGGCASYVATREANRALAERDEREERLDARSAARLVDNELAVIQATLDSARALKIRGASLTHELRKLPMTAWTANRQRLARTLRAREWGYVSQAYTLIRLLPSGGVSGRGMPPSATRSFVRTNVGWARRELAAYQ